MRILVLANRFPYPPFRGDKLKIYNLMRRLCSDHELHLVAFSENQDDYDHLPEIEPFFNSISIVDLPKSQSILSCVLAIPSKLPFQIAYFRSKKMHKQLQKVLSEVQPDLVYVQHLRMAQYAQKLDLPKILDLPDAFSLYWERRKKTDRPWYNKIFDPIELKRLRSYEPVMKDFTLNLACSVEDRDYLREQYPAAKVELLRNGVDLSTFKYSGHDYSKTDHLLFTGNMDYAPNVDAVQYFVEEIFPQIITERPNVHLTIAGQRPIDAVTKLASERIKVTGFVPDLSEMYQSASVVIAPLRFGAGTQNKVLEAMAMGVPVVCTNIGFKGLQIKSGEGVILAPEKEEFASAVIDLLNSEEKRENIGQKGLNVARSQFSWDGISKVLDEYWHQTINTHKSS